MNRVSVIIVNWNGKDFLSECLEGLRSQSYRDFETIVVDNNSKDGSVEFVRKYYPEVRIVYNRRNIGFAAANNVVLKDVQTEYAALINNDAVTHKFWLENMINALESHNEAGFAACKMVFRDKPQAIDRAGDFYSRAGAGILQGRGESSENYNNQEWIFGACAGAALYRMRMLRDIGLFDEDFFILYEDVDLSFRAQLMGYKCIYVPEALVFHKASNSLVYDSPTSVYYGHRNLEWVYFKNMPAQLILKTILQHFIYDIMALLYFLIRGRGKYFIKSKRDAVKGLRKTIQKRRQIQRNRVVDDDYIWRLLEKELFFHRWDRRLHKN